MKKSLLFLFVFTLGLVSFSLPKAWINEFHYDNESTDVNEAPEVVIDNTSSYSLHLAGSGNSYSDFTWQVPGTNTFDSVNTGQTLTAFGPNIAPPVWTSGYPKAINIVEDKGTLVVNMDEPGTVYYIVIFNEGTPPTSEQVKAGVNYDTVTVLPHGSINVTSANTDYFEIIPGANPNTAYDIWVVAEDDEAMPNLQATPVKVDVTTTGPRSLSITTPQPNDVYALGDLIILQWTAINIDSIVIGIYSYADDSVYLDIVDEVYSQPIDASLGILPFPIPHLADAGTYDIIIFDYYDTTFNVSVGPLTLEDNRVLEFVSPLAGETYYVGDTVVLEWIYTDIDSVYIGGYDYTLNELFLLTMDEYGEPDPIEASRDTLSFVIPLDAITDSVDLIILDAADTSFYDRIGPVYISDATAINETDFENSLIIYPNPGSGLFNLDFTNIRQKEMDIRISNISGQTVFTRTLYNPQGKIITIDLTQEPVGLYFIQMNFGERFVVKKIIIR